MGRLDVERLRNTESSAAALHRNEPTGDSMISTNALPRRPRWRSLALLALILAPLL